MMPILWDGALRHRDDRGDGLQHARDRLPARGGARVVTHGETGYVVDTVEEMAAAVGAVGVIDRAKMRQHCEAHFSDDVIADRYLAIYARLAAGRTAGSVSWVKQSLKSLLRPDAPTG